MADARPQTATELLLSATTEHGILASTIDRANYRRIWARDGIVCGLAGLLTDESALADGLRATLSTLADAQGPDGQIPSNVSPNRASVSFGGLAGRVDPSAWFVIGCCAYSEHTGKRGFAERHRASMERALQVLTTWEFNRRGLVYVPQGGDWADEYVLHGYVLYVQLVRLWALRAFAATFDLPEMSTRANSLTELICQTFWPSPAEDPEAMYHPQAHRKFLEEEGEASFFLASLAPGGYSIRFDAWSNALAVLLELPTRGQQETVIAYGQKIASELPFGLLPAFWPPIRSGESGWDDLTGAWRDRFSNTPGHYHNGGLWPVVNGWWGAALARSGRKDQASRLLRSLRIVNQQGDFPEYLDATEGAPHGTCPCTWSAAGEILLEAALDGRSLPFLTAP